MILPPLVFPGNHLVTTDNFCFYLQNRLIQPVKQEVNTTGILPPLVFPGNNLVTTDNFCFYLQNKLIQTSQAGGQWYSDTFPFSIPWLEWLFHWTQQLVSLSDLKISACQPPGSRSRARGQPRRHQRRSCRRRRRHRARRLRRQLLSSASLQGANVINDFAFFFVTDCTAK